MITHAASRKQYTVLLDRPARSSFFHLFHLCEIGLSPVFRLIPKPVNPIADIRMGVRPFHDVQDFDQIVHMLLYERGAGNTEIV